MPPPGGEAFFHGRPVGDLRKTVLEDIESRAAVLGPESEEHIPEDLFVYGVFSEYDFSLPTLAFDRVFSKDVEIEGTRYLELHVPMVGYPRNLDLAPTDFLPTRFDDGAFEYEVVDGDMCFHVELSGNRPAEIATLTDGFLAILERRYHRVESALADLERTAERKARREFRKRTGKRAWGAEQE